MASILRRHGTKIPTTRTPTELSLAGETVSGVHLVAGVVSETPPVITDVFTFQHGSVTYSLLLQDFVADGTSVGHEARKLLSESFRYSE